MSGFLSIFLFFFGFSFAECPHPPSVLVTVKTTRANHGTRLREAINTWAAHGNRPKGMKILFVSDSTSNWPTDVLDSHCPSGHQNEALCCKMGYELRLALAHQTDFWCHFDDDSFVLLHNLHSLLSKFPAHFDLYLGRSSTASPIGLTGNSNNFTPKNDPTLGRPFWFGTGGAGICLSRSTVQKLEQFVESTSFELLCAQLGVPDDVTLGFVLNNLLGIRLTKSDLFHSHLERLNVIPRNELAQQVSLSASPEKENFVDLPPILPPSEDPMRFRTMQKFVQNSKVEREEKSVDN